MLVSLEEPPFKSTGAGHAIVSRVKQAGQKTSPAQRGTPLGTQEEEEIGRSLEARSGFAGRLPSCGSPMQGEDTKGQSSARVETGYCCARQQERILLSMLVARGAPRKTLDPYLTKMVPWQIGMQKKQGHSTLFLPQSLILMIGLGLSGPLSWRTTTAATVTFHLWARKL